MKAEFRDIIPNYFLGAVMLLQTTLASLHETKTISSTIATTSTTNMLQMSEQTFMVTNITNVITPNSTELTKINTKSYATSDVIFSRKIWTKNGGERKETKHNQNHGYKNHYHEHHWGPFFEEPLWNATQGALHLPTHLSTETILNCRVGMLQDKTVMWVRRTTEKVSLLTVGNVTYSADPRINVKFQYPNNWKLSINPVKKEDAGLYMCQVSTHPPKVFVTNLTVLDLPIQVIDEKGRKVHDRYFKPGSTIDLTCQVNKRFIESQKSNLKQDVVKIGSKIKENELTGIEILKHILWRKDNDIIRSEAISNKSYGEEWYSVKLKIPNAKFSDDGLYICSVEKLQETVVQVQILTGELPAAVQHNFSSRFSTTFILLPISLFYVALTYQIHIMYQSCVEYLLFIHLK